MKKAAVVVPPVRDFYHTHHRFSGLGAHTAASVLERHGWVAEIFNFPLERKKGTLLPLPGELQHLAPFLLRGEQGPLSFFTEFRQFGPSFDECGERIRGFSPDAVFISCFAFCYADETIRMAETLHGTMPGIPIIIGGAGATVLPEYFTRHPAVHAVISGEAETGLADFLGGAAPSNRRYTESGEILPAFSITRKSGDSLCLSVSVSRGCPGRCRFCSNHLTHGRRFRTATVETVRERLSQFPDTARLTVNFEDDNLLACPGYFFELLDAFRSRFRNGVRFLAENGIDYTLLDGEVLERLIQAGLLQFNLSLASLDPGIRAGECRHGDTGKLPEVLLRLQARSVPSVTYFICGLEHDTRETVIGNLSFLNRLPTRTGISLFYPVPGLPGFEDASRFLTVPARRSAGSSAWPWTGSLDTRSLITAFRLARFSNLLKELRYRPGTVSPADKELADMVYGTGKLHTFAGHGTDRRQVAVPEVDQEMVDLFLADTGA